MKETVWLLIKDSIIIEKYTSNADQSHLGMIAAPWNSDAKIGEPAAWYTKSWKRIPDGELVKRGIRFDNRGLYWNKADFRQTFVVRALDETVPDGYTGIAPSAGEQYQRFNDAENAWAVDAGNKEIASLELEITELRAYLDSTDYKVIKSAETGSLIGDAILQKRQKARDGINAKRGRIAGLEKKALDNKRV
jgi:hypothetical protein